MVSESRIVRLDKVSYLCTVMLFRIIPSFLVDKASCTRQFENEFSLHSLASLFPIKEGSTSHLGLLQWSLRPLRFPRSRWTETFLTLKEGSTSHLGLLPSGTRGCNRPIVLNFLPLRLSCKESSTSNQAFLLRRKDVTALRCSEPLRYKVVGPRRSSPYFAGWDRLEWA